MHTLKKNAAVIPLTKSHQRWAWMAGATAAVAASPHSLAQTAQISLINNQVDSLTGNSMVFAVSLGHTFASLVDVGIGANGTVHANAQLHAGSGVRASAIYVPGRFASARISFVNTRGRSSAISHRGPSLQSSFGLFHFTLSDPHVAGDRPNTNALLELEAVNQSATDQTVALLAVFYDTTDNNSPSLTINSTTGTITGSYTNVGSSNAGVFTPAPEPSGLALLALGAGGILARRQRRQAA
jgi:hypothetical protein